MQIQVRDKKYKSRHFWIGDHYVRFFDGLAMVSPEDAVELLKIDDQFEILSDFACTFNPDTWNKKYKKLIWEANTDTFSGFGSAGMNIIKALGRLGVDVYFNGKQFDEGIYRDAEFDKYKKNSTPDSIMVQFRQPGQFRRKMTERMFGYTPWETTRVPLSWIARMNSMEAMFTTCEQNAQAFKESGVKVPIHVFHHGVDPEQFPFLERDDNDPVWVFGTYGRLSYRKGTDLVIKAFQEEFKNENDVALVLKSTEPYIQAKGINDGRIIFIGEIYDRQKQIDLMRNMDVFLFPSRGEGFGLPAIEAMSTGLPTIMTNWSGLKDFGDVKDTMLIDYEMRPATNFTKEIYREDCGDWAEPNYQKMMSLMRWSYENRKEAREMGRRASQRIHAEWNWEAVTKKFIKTLDKII